MPSRSPRTGGRKRTVDSAERLQCNGVAFLFETLRGSSTGSAVVHITQTDGEQIVGALAVPQQHFFDFMEVVIHLAAAIEPRRSAGKKKERRTTKARRSP